MILPCRPSRFCGCFYPVGFVREPHEIDNVPRTLKYLSLRPSQLRMVTHVDSLPLCVRTGSRYVIRTYQSCCFIVASIKSPYFEQNIYERYCGKKGNVYWPCILRKFFFFYNKYTVLPRKLKNESLKIIVPGFLENLLLA